MRVISLEAENFKRLRAVSITPSGNLVEVSGDNGEGKTSTLDAIWAALGGKDACPDKPIHSGATEGRVTLTLGDAEPKLVVTRTFKLKEGVPYTTTLTVESAEGARFGSAQGVLDTLVGALCFDPMAFLAQPAKDQIAALRKFVGEYDFGQAEGLNKRDFDNRTEVGRRLRDLKGQLAALPQMDGDPPEPVDTAALEQELAWASEVNTEIERRKANRQAAEERAQGHADRASGLRAQAAALIEQAEEEEGLHANLRQQIDNAEALPAPIDVTKVREQLEQGRHTNSIVAKFEERQKITARIKEAEDTDTALTAAIAKRKDEMTKAVQAAAMPIKGLGFAEDERGPFVTLNGEPLAQASKAEQIRASVAIAAAMNPKLRVARVMDGSLLDRKSWAALEAYAKEHDLQVWVETVRANTKGAILIEDGGVAAQDPPAAVGEVGEVL